MSTSISFFLKLDPTAVNAMLYCRDASPVFDEWAKISGSSGLAWNSLLKDFKATSHYTFQPADYNQVVNTNITEMVEVSRSSGLTGFDLPFASALESTLGLQQKDFTDGTGIGYDLGLGSIRVSNRTRSYALNTFGYGMANRLDLQLIHNGWIQQIGFLGAINSPKLLMLSRVEPKAQLSALNIPVVADNPHSTNMPSAG